MEDTIESTVLPTGQCPNKVTPHSMRKKRKKTLSRKTSSAKRVSNRRCDETPDQSQSRIARVREATSTKRAHETIDQTKNRLSKVRRANLLEKVTKNSHGKKNATTSAFPTESRAAFTYDATVSYDTHPEVQIGKMTVLCSFCNSLRFKNEAPSICCSNGTVKLSHSSPHESAPPKPLLELLTGNSQKSKKFQKQTRQYNSAFK